MGTNRRFGALCRFASCLNKCSALPSPTSSGGRLLPRRKQGREAPNTCSDHKRTDTSQPTGRLCPSLVSYIPLLLKFLPLAALLQEPSDIGRHGWSPASRKVPFPALFSIQEFPPPLLRPTELLNFLQLPYLWAGRKEREKSASH